MQLSKFNSATASLSAYSHQCSLLSETNASLQKGPQNICGCFLDWATDFPPPKKKHKAMSCPSTSTTVTKIECYLRIFEVFLCASAGYERSVSEAPLKHISCKGLLLSQSWKDTLPTNIHVYFISLQEFFSSWPWVLQPRSWFKEISTLIWEGTQIWVKFWFLVSCLSWWVEYL